MKYLVIVLVVAVLLWLARSGRRRVERNTSSRGRADAGTEPMVRCAHCGLHLPRGDALAVEGDWYCDEAHRAAHARARDAAR